MPPTETGPKVYAIKDDDEGCWICPTTHNSEYDMPKVVLSKNRAEESLKEFLYNNDIDPDDADLKVVEIEVVR